MSGWKTWLAAACTTGLGVVTIIQGDVAGGIQQVIAALALIGVGHKIEKITGK